MEESDFGKYSAKTDECEFCDVKRVNGALGLFKSDGLHCPYCDRKIQNMVTSFEDIEILNKALKEKVVLYVKNIITDH